jgi:hypothetical protein
MRYLHRRYGHPDEVLSPKGALMFLVAEECPMWAAQALIRQAESRVKLMRELAIYSGSERDTFEATITAELHVELSPDPRALTKQPALL